MSAPPVPAVADAVAQVLLAAQEAVPPVAVPSVAAEVAAVVAHVAAGAPKVRSDAAEERSAGVSPNGQSAQSSSRCKRRPSVVSTFLAVTE